MKIDGNKIGTIIKFLIVRRKGGAKKYNPLKLNNEINPQTTTTEPACKIEVKSDWNKLAQLRLIEKLKFLKSIK